MDSQELQESMVMMKDGQLMTVRNGELVLLRDEITMPDGTRVQPDGNLLMADGTSRRLSEGETLRVVGVQADSTIMPETGRAQETIERRQPGDAESPSDNQLKEEMEDEELSDQM